MKDFFSKISKFLLERRHEIYSFLYQNGFFEEMIRGIIRLIFLIVFLRISNKIW